MQEARKHPRVDYRLAVDLYCADDGTQHHCYTQNIGLGGMYALGLLGVRPGASARVSFGREDQGALQILGLVTRVGADGAGLAFSGNVPTAINTLDELLQPDWDGENLLEGVMRIAPWYRNNDLAGWMRLTTMVSDWQRLTTPAQREFRRSLRRQPNRRGGGD